MYLSSHSACFTFLGKRNRLPAKKGACIAAISFWNEFDYTPRQRLGTFENRSISDLGILMWRNALEVRSRFLRTKRYIGFFFD